MTLAKSIAQEFAGSALDRYLRSQLFKRDLLLTALTLAAYGGVCDHELVNLDDNKYIQNIWVESGLSPDDMLWSFTTFDGSSWHPFTWLSLQLDTELFGPTRRTFHTMNLLYHIANVLLLSELFRRMTGRVWASAVVAAIFGVHPQHVESVAWATERKDVLSTFFGLLALLAYVHYARRPTWKRLLLVTVFFAASLLSKSMLVTLPCLMWLFDIWPLRRLRWGPGQEPAGEFARCGVLRLIVEKLPLFALVVGTCIMGVWAQQSGGALKSLGRLPMGLRFDNAVWSTACYLAQTFWPVDLAAYYPYPLGGIPSVQVAVAALLLVLATLIACIWARSHPYLLVGWLWFLGTLVPVIGLVQVGSQARADRYTYFPSIGVYLMLTWALFENVAAHWRVALAAPVAVALGACIWLTRIQASYWANSTALWEHTLAVTSDNFFAWTKYGEELRARGKREAALAAFQEAVRIYPRMDPALALMGEIYQEKGQSKDAEACYQKALEARPDSKRYQQRLEQLRRLREKGN